ncbi:MAG: aminopeptidase, partial [Ruminococcus sp.]|nr:aminopeptidase [Ruminococcus sp.]
MPEKNKLKEKLFSKKTNAVLDMSAEELKKCDDFCENYKTFLDIAKTEREAVDYTVELLQKNGFKEFKIGMKPSAGDKIYRINRGKAVIAAIIGSEPIEKGVRLCAAHIDSPRL